MQNIGILANSQAANKIDFGRKGAPAVGDISFAGTIAEAVRLGKIVVPTKTEAGRLNFEQNKFVSFDEIKYDDEEEKINAFISRIEKILEENKGEE